MTPPPFFLGTVLLFWGWQVQTLAVAVCLAGIIESPQLVKTRFEFTAKDFNKFVDISIVLLAATVVTALTIDIHKALATLLKWLPLVLFPMVAAQEYASGKQIDTRSFFLATRRRLRQPVYETGKINISYLFSFASILASASANRTELSFFYGLSFFSAWALWQTRPKRYRISVWLLFLVIIPVSGFIFQHAIKETGIKVSRWAMQRFAAYYSTDPFKSHTAIGDIGELKFFNTIALRISLEPLSSTDPFLLHRATYNRFSRNSWLSSAPFTRLEPQNNQTFWQINPKVPAQGSHPAVHKNFETDPLTRTMTIYSRPVRNKSVLSLPAGTLSIGQMEAGLCEKNKFQTVRAEDLPGLIISRVSYSDAVSFDALPQSSDLSVPENVQPGILKFTQLLNLKNRTEPEILSIVKSHFSDHFTYSLDLKGKGEYKTALENFLFHTRSGHCEFYATATALILRQAGIPTRYATGFIAHEYSPISRQIIVRNRDAHAWTKVFINGRWEDFDTTPSSFLEYDARIAPPFWLTDIFSYIGFNLSRLRHETGKDLFETYGILLLLPLGVILFFRLRKAGQIKRLRPDRTVKKGPVTDIETDAVLELEAALAKAGHARQPSETRLNWAKRISPHLNVSLPASELFQVITLYNFHRFSREKLTPEQKAKLDCRLSLFLASFKESTGKGRRQ